MSHTKSSADDGVVSLSVHPCIASFLFLSHDELKAAFSRDVKNDTLTEAAPPEALLSNSAHEHRFSLSLALPSGETKLPALQLKHIHSDHAAQTVLAISRLDCDGSSSQHFNGVRCDAALLFGDRVVRRLLLTFAEGKQLHMTCPAQLL
jgi:hypothetical protein